MVLTNVLFINSLELDGNCLELDSNYKNSDHNLVALFEPRK